MIAVPVRKNAEDATRSERRFVLIAVKNARDVLTGYAEIVKSAPIAQEMRHTALTVIYA